ncbi:MAG: ABC transporter ATP-binding protein [Rhodospirillales bacterium]|nr:ABC transporter ATP-binding protein [Rhodospirillales bacterium]
MSKLGHGRRQAADGRDVPGAAAPVDTLTKDAAAAEGGAEAVAAAGPVEAAPQPSERAKKRGRQGAAATPVRAALAVPPPALALPAYATHGPVRFLLHYVRRRIWSHLIVLTAILAAVGCAIGSQYAVKNLVDVLSMGKPSDAVLWGAVVFLLGLVAADNLLWRVAGYTATHAFPAVGGDMRLDLFDHLSGHGTRYFSDRFPGALAGRITTAANSSWQIENSLAWTTIPPAAAVITAIALLASINWQITAVLLVIISVLGGIIAKLASNGSHLHARFAGRAAAVTGDLTDVVSNIGLVRAFGSRGRERDRLGRKIRREMFAQRQSLRSLERLRLFHAISVFTVTAGVLTWAITLWRSGSITIGDVVLTTTLSFTVLNASRDFATACVDVIQHFAKLGEAVQVLALPHEMADAADAKPLINLGGSVEFANVSFSYPNGTKVLQGFNLGIVPGQKVGLVGRSGSGKTTILALLQRLYDPDGGQVLIDGQDISKVTQDSLRHSIAVVQQEISLFHRSILENLRYGKPEATDEEVYRAAEAAHCTEFISRLPEGFQTMVGERGVKLSGGQRQRLAIARAFLRDAPIILLDEATSALDTESEQSIQEALMRLVKGRTVIAIAHRLSTLDSFDRIVVLDHGCIVEDGPSIELLERNGIYSRMYSRQLSAAKGSHE